MYSWGRRDRPAPLNPAPEPSPAPRLRSLDALRGFDMMWIVGGDAVANGLGRMNGGPAFKAFAAQFDHVDWAGYHVYDLIFPLFVFMIGVSITFSLGRMVAAEGRAGAVRRILRRTLLLYVLGLFYYGGLDGAVSHIRLLGVLQRLALCYGAAGLLFVFFSPRVLLAVLVGLLVGYWALLRFVPVPGFGAGDFAEGHNLTNWLDRRFLPWRKWDGDHDPEGMLSTLPAVASCLLGVLSGLLLRDTSRTQGRRAALLAALGAAALALGLLWSLEFPIIKKIWTSSFVLVAGGWSMLALSLFYTVIDIWKVSRWSTPFVWIGTNALAIYLATNIADFWKLASRFVGGDVSAWLDAHWTGSGGLLTGFVSILICMALGRLLYQRKVFLRL